MLVWMICIAKPFVTKPSMMRHHYKPERQGHSNWISVHTIKYDYFYYMFWTAEFFGNQLSLTVHVHKLEVALLYSRSRSQWRFWTSANVCPDNISDPSNLVWWCITISQRIIQNYHFAMFKVKATIVSTRSSEILKLLQSESVWWYIITRQGKTLRKSNWPMSQLYSHISGVFCNTWDTDLWHNIMHN